MKRALLATLAPVLVAIPALAQEFTVQEKDAAFDKPDYSPFVDQHYPDRVFWGDTHLHTSNSPDAGLVGNTLGPDMAYRFARGEEVTSATGLRVKLKRPLDFLVVSDHSEYMGLAPMLQTGDPALLADPTGKRWYDMFNAGQTEAYNAFREVVQSVTEGKQLIQNDDVMRTVWERNNATADEFNEPGKFAAFIGYEWSSLPNGNNLHRVVIFRDGATRTNQVVPFPVSTALMRRSCGSTWPVMRRRPAGKSSPSRTTGMGATARCFPTRRFPGNPSTVLMRRPVAGGNRSMKLPKSRAMGKRTRSCHLTTSSPTLRTGTRAT